MPYFEYREIEGWAYYTDVDRDEDWIKTWHFAKHIETGIEKAIDHSPYEFITIDAFTAHVRLSFPPREGSVPWNNQTIKEKFDELLG